MTWIPDRYRELRSLLRPERVADEVDEELTFHLEQRTADLRAAGVPAAEAREQALQRFGEVRRYAHETISIDVSMRKEQRRMELLDAIRREAKQTVRSLLRAPAFAAVAILTLGLGIGATTSIYSLIDSIVLRPLPFPEPDRLVHLWHNVPGVQVGQRWGNSVASYFYYVDNNRTFETIGAYTGAAFNLSGDGEAERVDGTRANAAVLTALGARTVHGRLFTDDDARPGAEPVALLSHALWTARYGGDRAIVGRTVTMSGTPVTVIGVLAPGVRLPSSTPAIWRPLALDRTAEAVNMHHLSVLGRLHPSVTMDAARADLQRLTAELPTQFPGAYDDGFVQSTGFHADVTSVRAEVLGNIPQVLWMLLGSVALVLLIACANVANLLIVRAETRRREMTVRAALGAERAHFAVHHLTESLLLALAAGGVGVLLAFGGIKLLLAMAPVGLPRLDEVTLDMSAIGLALGAALLTGLFFGIVPLLRSHMSFSELREGGRGLTSSRNRQFVRGALVVTQVAMALMLLAAGGLMLRSFLNLHNVRSGIDPENVLTFQAVVTGARYPDPASVHTFQRELVERLEAFPGVAVASGTTVLPLASGASCSYTTWEGKVFAQGEAPPCLPIIPVLPNYFAAMGIAVRGETFDWAEVERRRGVVVVSRAVAERLWPGGDPIGKGIISYQDGPPWYRVIGVADDVRSNGLDEPPVEALYYPTIPMTGALQTGPWRFLTFIVKTATANPEQLAGSVRQIVASIDPAIPVAQVRTMAEVVRTSPAIARRTFTMVLLAIASGMALFLSAVGLYGVITYVVGRRRAEIGIRMALGARISQVGGLVVLQSVRLAALGVAIGILGTLAFTRLLESLLFGVEAADPLTIAAVSALLLIVALLASLLPAWRAARTDPVEALRAD